MRLRHTNPLGQMDVPLIGRQGHPDDKIGEDDDGNPVALQGSDRHGFGCLEPGEEFDASPEHAEILLAQRGNYEPADTAAQAIYDKLHPAATYDNYKVTQLRELATDRGLDTTGRKSDLIERLTAYDREAD